MLRVGILSDTMGITSPYVGGHGLGRAVWSIAEGLQSAGHTVTLFALEGSSFSGQLMVVNEQGAKSEPPLARAVYERRSSFDVILDHSHKHILSQLFPSLPVINFYHDRWQPYRQNAVLMSEGQRKLMGKEFTGARVVHHQIDAKQYTPSWRPDNPPYALFMGFVYRWKQPILAVEAAAKAGMHLLLAGSHQENTKELWSGSENSRPIGAVAPETRNELMRGATVYLQLGDQESFGLTTIEAGLHGTPTVAWPSGGSLDTVKSGVNGVLVDIRNPDTTEAVVSAIHQAKQLNRKQVREYTEGAFGCPPRQMEQIEALMTDVVEGRRWQ
jgi:glycosyltransferase involved in cell wall biosynthesis